MTAALPFEIIPWQEDFTASLAALLLREYESALADCRILFPHHRPARYLARHLAGLAGRPVAAPRMQTMTELMAELRGALAPEPLAVAGQLDRVALLLSAVQRLRDADKAFLPGLPLAPERFLPWGVRLAELMEELMRHGLPPKDLFLGEDDALPEAQALLGHLRAIYNAYVEALGEHGLTTPGNDCRIALSRLDDLPGLQGDAPLLAAGFHALTGAEDRLLNALWRRGAARILWHADPGVAHGDGHWSLQELVRWRERWGADAVLLEPAKPQTHAVPKVRFMEAYDRHSQLLALRRELERLPEDQAAAVVVPDTGLLPPVLHHLPERDCNISMGYPLARASLWQLVEIILALQEEARDETPRRYPWRRLAALARHPYLKMLGIEEDVRLRPVLRQWEKSLRQGGGFVDPRSFIPDYQALGLGDAAAALEALRRAVLSRCIDGFANVRTLSDLGRALAGLVDLLVTHGEGLWRDYLLDAECLCRLRDAVLPELMRSRLAETTLPAPVLFAILRQITALERVPFEPEPITGLQVVGMLETRLLHFGQVYLLDATEERLPGTPEHDPLLPDSLRALLGLPDIAARDSVAAATFFRLLAGAKEVVLLYRQGETKGVLDTAPVRSRFVEMLLWEEEKRRGRLIEPGEPPLERVTLPLSPIPRDVGAVAKTEAVREALWRRLLAHGLSATALDAYMRCPKSFFLRQVCRLTPPEEAVGDADPAALGDLVHRVLKDFLTPYLGQEVTLSELSGEELGERFALALKAEEFYAVMPYDARVILERTGRVRLGRFLARQPRATILALEEKLSLDVPHDGRIITVHGIIDRLDRREAGLVVADYKTGKPRTARTGLWEAPDLWGAVETWTPDSAVERDPLPRLAEMARSLQLPLYMTLCRKEHGEPPVDGLLIALGQDGKEISYFPAKFSMAARERVVTEQMPLLLGFLLRHLLETPVFSPYPGDICRYCDVRGPCGA